MVYSLNAKIISWHIQSTNTVNGSKFYDPQFCAIFENSAFICLQETRQPVKHPGFRAFNNNRRNNKYGGVCIMVRNDISRGITEEKSKIEDVIACKLNKDYFGLERDIYIVNSYIKPAQTSSKKSEFSGLDILHELDQFVNTLRGKGKVICCGDFNARIGLQLDFIDENRPGHESYIPLPDDYSPQDLPLRNTKDKTTNSYSRPFLDMLLNNELHILNGRTIGDLFGEYTCLQPSGASVVDYFIISPDCQKHVNHMSVLDFTCFSDHKPLMLALKLSLFAVKTRPLQEAYVRAPLRYKIGPESYSALRHCMDNPEIEECTQSILDRDYPCDRDGTYKLNHDLTTHLQKIAELSFKNSKHPKLNKNGPINKQPWFNQSTREAKVKLDKAANIVSEFPDSDYLRRHFYLVKGTYKRIVNQTKTKYFDKLNSDIESGKVLNWKQFKKLKKHKTNVDKFDSYDMENFEKFFAKLYSNYHPTVSPVEKENFLHKATSINKQQTVNPSHSALNEQILVEEILTALKSFKNGKSSSDDMISNEILKSLSESNLKLLCKTFNQCLESGTYPWNNSIITPLHKKGCKSNPDNYRAVAVSSTIGKLFSTVILNRLIQYKNSEKPDPVNQLGFSKGAQTYDHILTLNTITSKYKKLKQPVYAVFVDFRKAFDSVCREALFLKLAKLGINGKVFDVLKHMYQNSTGQIKLSGFLSKKFDINKGTEQGHPLSPDLFKIYIRDLSSRLDHENCPKLLNQLVSHLLWADDLILLAQDPETLQKQLDTLNKFCQEWGIEINVDKTKLMKFNSQFSNQLLRPTFKIGAHSVKEVESYCYLGIEIHQSGAFTLARGELKKKAMRALYALKNTVNKTKLSFRSTTTLFDSLIKPIVLYGAPIYTPTMSIIKTLKNVTLSDTDSGSDALLLTNLHKNLLRKISLLNNEKVHLHFLKWAMGVNKKATNAGVWGDSGRYPLLYESINLTVKYANRLHNLKDSSLVSLAYEEQKKLNLDWYRGLEPILELDPCFSDNHVAAFRRLTLTNNHSTHSRPNISQQENTSKENFLVHKGLKKRIPPQSARPLRSKIFTPYIIIKTLKADFKKILAYDHKCIS